MTISKIPKVADMQKTKSLADLKSYLDSIDPLVYPLISWIVESCQATLEFIPSAKVLFIC